MIQIQIDSKRLHLSKWLAFKRQQILRQKVTETRKAFMPSSQLNV